MIDQKEIKQAIMAQVILFQLNGTMVVYKSDGLEFSMISDPRARIFFLAKLELSTIPREFKPRPYTAENL